MTPHDVLQMIWRRRRLALLTAVACFGAVVALVAVLPRSYRATATLVANAPNADAGLADQYARTYAALAGNPNVAEQVRGDLRFRISRRSLLDHMSFIPVERTQLIEVSAEFGSAARAQTVANTYASVFARRAQVRIGANTLRISELASRPTDPVRPNPPLYLGFGAILAVLLGAGAGLLRDGLDRRVRVGDGDRTLHGAPIAGRIPAGKPGRDELVTDAYRLLRATLDIEDAGDGGAIAVVTAATPQEDAAAVAVGFAAAAAADGESVVLVEADLRRPGLHTGLAALGSGRRAEVGLADYLADEASSTAVVTRDPEVDGLRVVWAGGGTTPHTGRVANERMRAFVHSLSLRYDRVVIAAPPVSVGADIAMLAALGSATLLVVDARATSDETARVQIERLHTFRAPGLVVVVANASVRAETAYYEAAARRTGLARGRRGGRARAEKAQARARSDDDATVVPADDASG
jgi:Mrp family chromosome partitioning ATPase